MRVRNNKLIDKLSNKLRICFRYKLAKKNKIKDLRIWKTNINKEKIIKKKMGIIMNNNHIKTLTFS